MSAYAISPKSKEYQALDLTYTLVIKKKSMLSLFGTNVSAGFPSPADDYEDRKLDLNEYLIKNNAATFFVRVAGDSMIGAGIFAGDLLIVDRSVEPVNNDIVIGYLDGEFTVKRMVVKSNELFLIPENSKYKTIKVTNEQDFSVWGVVTYVIHKTKSAK